MKSSLKQIKMKKLNILVFIVLSIFLSSCAKIYYTADSKEIASNQKTVAILPPKVSIPAKRKVEAEAIKEQQRTQSEVFQKEMYAWFAKRKMQDKFQIEVQDIETTNAKFNDPK
jgi:hypothetical protein